MKRAASAARGASEQNSALVSRFDTLEDRIVGTGAVTLVLLMAGEAGQRDSQDLLIQAHLSDPLSSALAVFAGHVGIDARSLRIFHGSRPLSLAASALAQGIEHRANLTVARAPPSPPPPPPPPAPVPAPAPAAAAPAPQPPRRGGAGGSREARTAAAAPAAAPAPDAEADGRAAGRGGPRGGGSPAAAARPSRAAQEVFFGGIFVVDDDALV